ncbi:hypothetical protein NLU66_01160 [Brachybacterium sp. NBEC-018]|uniref:inositol monophosphatase family protein n=1 Tax=Brachybacterium sp. NBEC-018 TaxID=2996004 RepID=UPI002174FE5F|nr:inositol monophosphatase family protein [Brachybacterium sp. NBEC-018]UVY84234.1 hypothetical protein NLU66_01160 [Brachybacterium sp. NBEC-018]
MDFHRAASLAVSLVQDAGDLAVAELERARVEAKGEDGDLVTHVDREAEHRIAAALAEHYPEHAVLGEENGEQGAAGDSRYRWLIDPLDGTNNYVLGLPVYGVCLTLCEDGEPVVAAVHDSPRRRTFWAVRGEGAWQQGADMPRRLAVGTPQSLRTSTVSFTQGYRVGHDDARRNAMFETLERGTKRLLRTWAPSADWGLLVTGQLAALVAYRNEIWDLVGGTLLASEAGAAIASDDAGELVVVGIPETVQELVGMLGADGGLSLR